ncbi:MAG: GNAT family N-acetyltransferase [Phormidesmis sp.]
MQFETQRLILRDWHPAQDARNAMDIYSDPQVTDWIDLGSRDTSIWQVQGRLQRYVELAMRSQNSRRSWAVVQKDIGRVIGAVVLSDLPDLPDERTWSKEATADYLKADYLEAGDLEAGDTEEISYVEIGWHFRPASWGFGYATEAASCVVRHSFEHLDLPLLLAVSQPENVRSIAMMDRLGMRYNGITTRRYGGKPMLLYKITAADWQKRRNDNRH